MTHEQDMSAHITPLNEGAGQVLENPPAIETPECAIAEAWREFLSTTRGIVSTDTIYTQSRQAMANRINNSLNALDEQAKSAFKNAPVEGDKWERSEYDKILDFAFLALSVDYADHPEVRAHIENRVYWQQFVKKASL